MSKHTWLAVITFLTFIALIAAGLTPVTAGAPSPVIHEDPAKVTPQPTYDLDDRLMLQLEQMFGSLDSVALHINASDFNASRLSLKDFDDYYALFKDSLARMNLTSDEYQQILDQTDMTASYLRAMVNNSESHDASIARFNRYWADGDAVNATFEAVGLEDSFGNISSLSRNLTASASAIGELLQNTSVSTSHLNRGIDLLNLYVGREEEQEKLPKSLLSSTNLVLGASVPDVSTGDVVMFHASLSSNNTTITGGYIRLYIDGLPAGNGTTGPDGTCSISCEIPGGSFARNIKAIAYYDPMGSGYTPGISNAVRLTRHTMTPGLTLEMTPYTARFGDVVHFRGMLTTDRGSPVPDHPVAIAFSGRTACIARTDGNGSYDCDMVVTARNMSGQFDVRAVYDPGNASNDALAYAASPPVPLHVIQESSSLTLEMPPQVLQGGDSVSFNGTLASSNGRPVAGEMVNVYAGNLLLANNTTGAGGQFNLTAVIPLNMTAGTYPVYAAYEPRDGMSLAGSRSGEYATSFVAAPPAVVVYGIPLIAFPGDTMDLLVNVNAMGTPVDKCSLTVNMSGLTIGEGRTSETGDFYVVTLINGSAGLRTVTVNNTGSGLLEGATVGTGMVLVMPFDLATTLVILAILAALAGLALARVPRVRRALSRALPSRRAPLPRPAVQVAPAPEAPAEAAGPAITRFEDEIARIEAFIAGGTGDRDVIAEIYQAARRIAGSHGYAVPESATHREFYRQLVAKEPRLNVPAGTITRHYEAAVFGDKRLSARDITGSLYSLKELYMLVTEPAAGGSASIGGGT